jgi:hypothetical protein
MRIVESPGALKRHRRVKWEFQQTFVTPLNDLPRFVDVIMSRLPGVEAALVELDSFVFEPRYELVPLFAENSLPQTYDDGLTIEALGETEVRRLLQAALSEWVDFLMVPTPRPFVLYADHDEYITFLAHRKGLLNGVTGALTAAKFRAVEYVRKL